MRLQYPKKLAQRPDRGADFAPAALSALSDAPGSGSAKPIRHSPLNSKLTYFSSLDQSPVHSRGENGFRRKYG